LVLYLNQKYFGCTYVSLDEPPLSAKAVPVKPVPGPLNIPPDEITSLAIKFS
jgi:hypothetical protein